MEIIRRDDLEEPYRHPYRFWLPQVWRRSYGTPVTIAGVLCVIGGAILEQTSDVDGWLVLAVLLALLGAIAVLQFMAKGAWEIWRVTRGWGQGGELERVRRSRPQAGERDPDLVHDEFAVTVEDSGYLYVWRFRTLEVYDAYPEDEAAVPGRPRHTAKVVTEIALDPHDTAVAAAQLAEAQDMAAEYERRARDRVAQVASQDREVEADRRAVAAALRHLTGQARR